MKKKISVIGLGYIGLPTSAILAKAGYEVSGIDINEKVVDTVNNGKIHFKEHNLDKYVKDSVNSGNLKAFTEHQYSDIYIICVPTPLHQSETRYLPNIDHVLKATRDISKFLKKGDIIILESTSPVGTTEKIRDMLIDLNVDVKELNIAYCPERVLPGNILSEFILNDRIVGGLTAEDSKIISDFYRTFVKGNVYQTSSKIAEMCKLVENSFRNINIAFANELSILSSEENISVWELISLANKHPRVNILQPGTGVGGHCIAIDPKFLVASNPKSSLLVNNAIKINENKTDWVFSKIKEKILEIKEKSGKGSLSIACLGLTFKPDIDDIRESTSLKVAIKLKKAGFEIISVEPNLKYFKELKLYSLDHALNNSDLIVILVKHKEFLNLNLEEIKKSKDVLDFVGLNS
tara:strand:+ start:5217 stop:6437 length:1221 start_codon:yes stop_codon:yes gene_type:complete